MRAAALARRAGGDGAATLAQAHRTAAARLRRSGVATPELDARLLLCAACGLTHEAFAAAPERRLTPAEADALERLVARREGRMPVSRILGRREFWGRDFLLGADTLDPRPDSETLVAAALQVVREAGRADAPLRVLDLGVGSGCLLLTLLAEWPKARGVGLDLSAGALRIARANAERLGLEARAGFVRGSWLDAIAGPFDVIVANPPYIEGTSIAALEPEVARHDPRLALDGGPDGLDAIRAIAHRLPRVLAAGGAGLLEVGAGQRAAAAALLARAFAGEAAVCA